MRAPLFRILAAAALAASALGAQAAGDANNGRNKVFQCQGCHGLADWKTAFPEVYRVPKLGGQHAAYIAQALHEYKNGNRSHPSMRAIAGSLSDEDIANLAAYYARGLTRTASK